MKNFLELAKENIVNHHNLEVEAEKITKDNVFVVWSCKTLQNKKAILSANVKGALLYEFTWNGNKEEGYLDCYKKEKNIVVK